MNTMDTFTNLHKVADRFNEICDENGYPYRAQVQLIWLDIGANWKDYSIVIRDLTRPANSVTSSWQINFKARDYAVDGDIDEAVEYLVDQCKKDMR